LCRGQLSPERLRLDVVGADPLAVDLDDRDQLPVTPLELRVAVDRDLRELEAELAGKSEKLGPCAFAEVTACCRVKNDLGRAMDTAPA
jgi:hypothetical protein